MQVATASEDKNARIWDTGSNQRIIKLTASLNRTARLWLTDLHDTINTVCNWLTRDLTAEERVQFDISDQEPTCPKS